MTHYQEAADEKFLEEINTNYKVPSNDVLINSDDDYPQLSEDELETFHALTMKGVFLVKTKPDLEPGFAFLAARVRDSTQKHWSIFENYVTHARCKR